MEIEAPLLPLPPSDRLHLFRTTNIIGIEATPFDPSTYQVWKGREVWEELKI